MRKKSTFFTRLVQCATIHCTTSRSNVWNLFKHLQKRRLKRIDCNCYPLKYLEVVVEHHKQSGSLCLWIMISISGRSVGSGVFIYRGWHVAAQAQHQRSPPVHTSAAHVPFGWTDMECLQGTEAPPVKINQWRLSFPRPRSYPPLHPSLSSFSLSPPPSDIPFLLCLPPFLHFSLLVPSLIPSSPSFSYSPAMT